MFHHVQYSSMGYRGRPNLNGPRAPAPQGPCAWERGNPKGEGLHLTWEALLPPLAAAPNPIWDLGGPAPSLPTYK